MPAIGETPLRLNVHELNIHHVMLIARIGDVAADLLTGPKCSGREFDTEPRAELTLVVDGPPDSRTRSFEDDLFLDAIGHVQPPGCTVYMQPHGCANDRRAAEGGGAPPSMR